MSGLVQFTQRKSTVKPGRITVWTVVQTVLTATFNSYGDRQTSTPPHKIDTPEPIDKKFCTIDYVPEEAHYTKFGTNRPVGASGQMGEI